jgi:hypothetical protein
MAQYEGSYAGRETTHQESSTVDDISGWAVGLTFFATLMLILLGTFHFITGLSAIFNDQFFVVREHYSLKIDTTAWGWIHMIGGILIMLAGVWLMTGSLIARIVAIAAAVISAIGNFYSIPYYPVWSILMLVLDFAIIWGVTSYGHYMSSMEDVAPPPPRT